ncbi:BTAD domain-containing putative transcriptional regulator [Streptomyces hygroscopicus]|uniref:AfsR/SARP family transcriptional regulator n=1 Tax=Streptomyces hygroscopicus TaxID=1912 RepID=UPI0007677A57|nr:BTAD domain-containing putative transcriptional regulator [Streptomyces hygroscopicus]
MRFTVLGPVRAWRNDVELELGPPKQRALLALLLVRAGQPVALSEIVDVLWAQDPPSTAVNVVHRHVGSVRRLLEPGLPARAEGSRLVRRSGGYRLNADADALDLLRFRHLGETARHAAAAGEPERAAGLFTQALALWQGPTATGVPADIQAHPVFSGVDRELLAVAKEAATTALDSGVPERLPTVLQQFAAHHALDETLQARLIQVLAATGRRAEALEVFSAARDGLAEQLGVTPGPELRAAHRRLLPRPARDAPGPPARTDPAPPARTDPVAPVQPGDPAAPATAPAVRPAQLPPDLPAFSGRQAELAGVGALLPEGADTGSPAPLVISAIDGMAGVGKTTLAVHWAHRVAHRFPDGQLYANLRGFDPTGSTMSPNEALRSFLHALGVPPSRVPTGLDAKTALYRSLLAGRRTLVLLDNALDSAHVRPLLPGAPGCLTIVTSRNQLHGLIAGEGARPLTLGPLSPAESHEALVRRLGTDRVAAEPRAVATIVRLCGRLPLALAVVAARAATRPSFPLSSVAAELLEGQGNLDAFAGADPSTDARTVFSWSYRALDPEAARLFRLLALHPGPEVSTAAAASVAGLPLRVTRALLATLTGAHLLCEHAPGRYTFHDLLRAYAMELVRDHDAEEIRRDARHRMFDHYLHTARTAATLLAPHRTEPLPLSPPRPDAGPEHLGSQDRAEAWLSAERAVLLSAVGHARDHGFPAQSWQLAVTLELFLDRRGHWQEQAAIQRTALGAARSLSDRLGEAHAHRTLGFAEGRLGRYDEAYGHLERALELFAELDEGDGRARTLRALAFLCNTQGRHQRALDHYRPALGLYHASAHLSGQASVLNEIGWTHVLRGEYEHALARCRQAVELHRRIGDSAGEAAALDSVGYAYHHLGRYEQALTSYRRALGVYREISDRYLEADTLIHQGDTRLAQGDVATALADWRAALEILRELNHPDARVLEGRLRQHRQSPRPTSALSG